ncbi:Hypothetical predicted protein [Octopus vulgaris]|uniref:Uncharacterized protein n=1 Tax=Octopus vulgaris TaxID=6645 RepID=A0AA36AXA9_OCTVU|nr:Hypothetical predicted protein [Octopus vulgaris]
MSTRTFLKRKEAMTLCYKAPKNRQTLVLRGDLSDDGAVDGVIVVIDGIVGVDVDAIMVSGAVTVIIVIICDGSAAFSVRDTVIAIVDVVITGGSSAAANPVCVSTAAVIDTDIPATVVVVIEAAATRVA